MLPFQETIEYFGVYRRYIGNRLFLVFLLTLLAAATEGLGVALLLPVFMLLDTGAASMGVAISSPAEMSELTAMLQDLVTWLGIQNSLPGILLFISLIFLLKGLIKFAEGAYKSHLQAQLMRELRARLLDAYANMDYRYYSGYNTGHFVNLINVQVQSLITSFDRYKRYMAAVIAVIIYFTFAFMISWQFASMALVAGGLVLLVFRRLNDYVRKLSRETAVENGTLNHFVVQTMQAFKYVAATAQMEPLRTSILASIRRLTDYMRSQGIAQAFTEALREPLSVAVLVVIIVVQLSLFDAPLAPILVALVLIYRAMGQLVNVQANWQATMRNIGSLEVVEAELERVAESQQQSGNIVLGPLQGGIELRRICFAYANSDETAVLNEISLRVPASRTIAFVGESGSGKSTLVDLLTLMLRPTAGELTIDGTPHRNIEVASWRRQIGYVSQETVVFDDTIANNICLWRGDYNADPEVASKVEQAALRAHARHFIDELPQGFNTRVGDRGVLLSGGQRQRLFISRELYKNPQLLILDEATSALDSESELVIKETIDKLKGSMTVIIIAHRLSTISDADYIYVLDKGRIVEGGTYEELVASPEGYFNRMAALQKL